MMNKRFVTLLALLFCIVLGMILGIVCEKNKMDAYKNYNITKETSNILLLISVRSQLDQGKTMDAEELLDIEINNLLTHIRSDSTYAHIISTDPTLKIYLRKINLIWDKSHPFNSDNFNSQKNMDWYPEFIKNYSENKIFLNHILVN